MRVSVLTTDGGPHSAEKLAAATAGQIIEIAATAAGEQELEGRRLEVKIIDILEKHHTTIQEAERAAIAEKGSDHLTHNHNPNQHVEVDAIVNEILDAGKQSKWADHFSKPDVVQHIRHAVSSEMATSIHIERLWHYVRNPHDEKAKAYHKIYNPGE